MNLETLEEKLVWALAYAAAEASTTWHERHAKQVDEHLTSQRADAAVIQFRKRCPAGSGSVGIIQREGIGKKNG